MFVPCSRSRLRIRSITYYVHNALSLSVETGASGFPKIWRKLPKRVKVPIRVLAVVESSTAGMLAGMITAERKMKLFYSRALLYKQ